jgi:hypothetical protein
MTDPDYRHYIIIFDRSLSMQEIMHGMQSGFDEFIADQSGLPGRATGSLWQFNHKVERLYAFQELKSLAGYQLVPRGNTALYDAIGQAVIQEGADLASLPEELRPRFVTVTIVSDGQENSSIEYSLANGGGPRIAAMLKHQQDTYSWQVVYMGTNQDAFAEGSKIAVGSNSTLSYAGTNAGSQGAWRANSSAMSRGVAVASAGGSFNIQYSAEERAMAEGTSSKKSGKTKASADDEK